MFKPQKSSEAHARKNREKLETWTRTPTLDDIRFVLSESKVRRGILFEVTIKRDQPPPYVLTCQWDPRGDAPVWTLYEGEDGSKSCWSYPNDNLEMIYEIICMSLPGGLSTSQPAKLVGKAAAMPPKNPDGSPVANPEPAPAAAPAAPAPAQAPAAAPAPAPAQAYPPAAPYAAPPGYPPGTPYPVQPAQGAPVAYPPGYPVPQQPYPPTAYPPGYPPGVYPGQPMQGAPMAYPPGYPVPQQPYPPAAYPPGQYQVAPGQPEANPADMSRLNELLSKGQGHMLLGQLFTEAGVLPEPCVDSALKLQELVRKGLISNAAAIEALKRASERGGLLDDDIINACREKYPQDSLTTPVATLKPAAALDPKEFARQVIQLVQQSGIVSESDVATAEAVRKKHGGDVGAILVAAGKVEKSALDAAKRCLPLVREHRLNHEEAFRILRHCQKTKLSADEAFQQLSIHVL